MGASAASRCIRAVNKSCWLPNGRASVQSPAFPTRLRMPLSRNVIQQWRSKQQQARERQATLIRLHSLGKLSRADLRLVDARQRRAETMSSTLFVPQAYAQTQIVEQAVVGTASLDDTLLTQFHTRCLGQDRSRRREVLERAAPGPRLACFRCNTRTSNPPISRISRTAGRKRSCGHQVLLPARPSIPTQRRSGTSEA